MSFLRVNPWVVVSVSMEGWLAYRIDTNQLHRLNPTAALLIELCDGRRTREKILATVAPLMPEGSTAACSNWLGQALAQGLIVEQEADALPAPPDASQLRDLAKDLRSNGRVLAAFICQERAAELAPDDPRNWYELGELAHIVGRREQARAAYERYQQSNPDDVEVSHLLVALRDQTPPSRASDTYIEQLYSHFASFYDENVCGDLDYRAPDLLLDAISAAIGSKADLSVLDLGCGTGLFGLRIRPRARTLVGIDLSAAMLDRARQRNIYDHLERAELTEWLARERSERFDVIAVCDTLIYFGDLTQVLPRAAAHLGPGGVIAFTVEAGETHPFRLTDSGRFAHHRKHLSEVADASGLQVVSLTAKTLRYEYGQPVAGWVTALRNG